MIKRTCDICNEEMPDDYDPVFVITVDGMRKVRVAVSLMGDDEDPGEDICHDCAKSALENIGFIEDDELGL